MRHDRRGSPAWSALALLAWALLPPSLPASEPAWDWPIATPESQGMSAPRLDAIQQRLAAKKTRAFLVIRNDHIVYEWYAPGVTANTKQGTASLAKALVGGMSLAIALTDGKISIDDPAAKFIPQWKDDPRKSKITLRHLGSHTSGLSDSTTENVKHEAQPGWMGDFWKRLDPPRDPFTLARDETPMLFEPGEKLQYSNPGIGLMTYCVTAAIRDGPEKDIRTLLRDRLMRPIGVADSEWSIGYGQTFRVDGLPLVAAWGGGAYTPRAAARIGRLVLREGDWQGRRLLSATSVRQVTGDAGLVGNCGMGWWSNAGRRYTKLPKDAVWGAGAGDQLLLVIPSLKLIMVRNGEALTPGKDEQQIQQDDVFTKYHDYRARILFEPLAEAVTSTATPESKDLPPRSALIKELRWSSPQAIRRAAKGSDNWPLTWADDDLLYGAFGDGNGFEPFTSKKLSLGFAAISGAASDFSGANIPSPTGEATGEGRLGRKASGLLCCRGILYVWVRNAQNSHLGWSADHGRTWSWADWKFTQGFGCPTFVNYGRNYEGHSDVFVYVISPDANDAYHAADRFDLARVPMDQVRDRAAYEFFAGAGPHGPEWTTEFEKRRPILERPGNCYRPNVTFNPGLKRFLMVQARPNARSRDPRGEVDVRFHGGLCVYEAPAPWGPWSVAFDTDQWDIGPGDSASFPAKWISQDGLTLHLVFSGDDCFAVREAKVTLAAPATETSERR